MGFIVSVSYDRAMYIYNEEHLHTPKKVLQASASRLTSVAWDKANNWLVTGSADGCVKVWSQEGRCLDQLVQCSDQVCLLVPLSCALPNRVLLHTGSSAALCARQDAQLHGMPQVSDGLHRTAAFTAGLPGSTCSWHAKTVTNNSRVGSSLVHQGHRTLSSIVHMVVLAM